MLIGDDSRCFHSKEEKKLSDRRNLEELIQPIDQGGESVFYVSAHGCTGVEEGLSNDIRQF